MSEARTQSARRHSRYFPLYHFFALPILSAAAFLATSEAFTSPGADTIGRAFVAWGLLAALVAARMMALKVQDRVIRLEETLRMQRVLPAELQPTISSLRARHFVALRFASDEELPALVRRVAAGELDDQKSIKAAITTWRPDWFRA